MKKVSSLLEFNDNAFRQFIHKPSGEQRDQLVKEGILVDSDNDLGHSVNLYFLNGFFVEEVKPHTTGEPADIIPYKHGYKTDSFLEIKEVLVPKLHFNGEK